MLEGEADSKLYHARLTSRREFAERALERKDCSARVALDVQQVRVGRGELRVIEGIERFKAQLQAGSLAPQPGLLRKNQIPVVDTVLQPELVASQCAAANHREIAGFRVWFTKSGERIR